MSAATKIDDVYCYAEKGKLTLEIPSNWRSLQLQAFLRENVTALKKLKEESINNTKNIDYESGNIEPTAVAVDKNQREDTGSNLQGSEEQLLET